MIIYLFRSFDTLRNSPTVTNAKGPGDWVDMKGVRKAANNSVKEDPGSSSGGSIVERRRRRRSGDK